MNRSIDDQNVYAPFKTSGNEFLNLCCEIKAAISLSAHLPLKADVAIVEIAVSLPNTA